MFFKSQKLGTIDNVSKSCDDDFVKIVHLLYYDFNDMSYIATVYTNGLIQLEHSKKIIQCQHNEINEIYYNPYGRYFLTREATNYVYIYPLTDNLDVIKVPIYSGIS